MTNGNISRTHPKITKITGADGQHWGRFVLPGRGKVTMEIKGTLLETKIVTTYGLEESQVFTRIERIETVQIVEGRLWWLLGIGFPLLFAFFIGVIPIALFFFLKQKWLFVHEPSGSLLLFYKDSQRAKEFCSTLLAVAQKANKPVQRQANGAQRMTQNGGQKSSRSQPQHAK